MIEITVLEIVWIGLSKNIFQIPNTELNFLQLNGDHH